MPASFGLECSHRHCTRVHNKRPQTPTSPCARAQLKTRASKKMPASTRVQEDARVYCFWRASKRMPASTASGARPRGCPRLLLLTRVQEDVRVYFFPRVRPRDARVYIDACKDARVACYLCAKDGRVRGGYRDRDLVSLPSFFQPHSPPR